MTRSINSAFENPIETDSRNHPLNNLPINLDFALPDFYSQTPDLISGAFESPLLKIPDERDVYSPNRKNKTPEADTPRPPIELPDSSQTNTNEELAALVAKIKAEEPPNNRKLKRFTFQRLLPLNK